MRSSRGWARSRREVRATDCQCRSRNSPWFDTSILPLWNLRGGRWSSVQKNQKIHLLNCVCLTVLLTPIQCTLQSHLWKNFLKTTCPVAVFFSFFIYIILKVYHEDRQVRVIEVFEYQISSFPQKYDSSFIVDEERKMAPILYANCFASCIERLRYL